ncbi:hypothetical protein M407DRAFT_19623 [Tulasnella calospora MUT 4182]|uniref:Uncharacterized protein n=1 Tax=Tulasnella calospora MUT 4182 TaxID=1051891 RepID=A0A0C3QRS3_9AGAM|nr:hypothetical protein M407DRAFT_19623 [Tulasnella calospora MUT 4182]
MPPASQTVPTPLPPSLTPTGQRRGGSINTGTGPAGLPPPLSSQRGLPNTSAPPPGAAKPAAGGDPPTANDHAAPSSALKAHQPGGSSAPHVVPAPKLAPGGDPFWDDEGSPIPPLSYGMRCGSLHEMILAKCTVATESSPARGHMPEAIYQTNLASPGPGWVFIRTAAGFIPVQSPAPAGLKTRELQGKSYAGRPGQQSAYDEDLRSGAAATRKLMTPSEDLNSRMDVDENFDYLNLDESLGRRPNQHNDDEDDDPYADLPEHPPARLLDHPPNHPANRRRPPRK